MFTSSTGLLAQVIDVIKLISKSLHKLLNAIIGAKPVSVDIMWNLGALIQRRLTSLWCILFTFWRRKKSVQNVHAVCLAFISDVVLMTWACGRLPCCVEEDNVCIGYYCWLGHKGDGSTWLRLVSPGQHLVNSHLTFLSLWGLALVSYLWKNCLLNTRWNQLVCSLWSNYLLLFLIYHWVTVQDNLLVKWSSFKSTE